MDAGASVSQNSTAVEISGGTKTANGRKSARAGRPPRDHTQLIASMFPEWSPRTRARFAKAWRQADFAEIDFNTLIAKHARPNGSLNVAALAEDADVRCAFYIAKHHPEILDKLLAKAAGRRGTFGLQAEGQDAVP